jgi:hypothetical protein
MGDLFAQVRWAFHYTLPKHPLTAPTHTPLGVWAGRQLRRCRRAQFVTGLADEDMDSLPVPDAVVEVFENVARIAAEHGVVPPENGGTTA